MSRPPAWLIAAPRSGAGKTTVTLGLIAALRRRGLRVRAAKAGPDYIDPAFLAAASGAPAVNLDPWAMPDALLQSLFADLCAEADIVLVEGAMGLFDGAAGGVGSAAALAGRLGLPVLLVLDVAGQAQTAAAVAHGLATFDPAVRVAAVVLNRVASPRHRRSVEAAMRLPVLGALPKTAPCLPERHLGLVQACELPGLAATLEALGAFVEGAVDVAALLTPAGEAPAGAPHHPALDPPGQRVALAQDVAFSFIYPHVVAGWHAAGAEVLPFSPLDDQAPSAEADCCWLPGGYPELHAGRLAASGRFMAGLLAFATTRPVHGECGGYMVLGQALTDAEGVAHPMAGLLGHATSFATRRLHLGYRRAVTGGGVIRGHEFHYATVSDPGGDAPYATVADAGGEALGVAGGRRGRVSGSFFHAIAQER